MIIFAFILQAVASSWLFWIHIIFNHVNTRNDYHLFRVWMKMSNETKREEDDRVIGLSRRENKKFWLAEDRFNHIYYRIVNFSLFFSYFIFGCQHFFCPWILRDLERAGEQLFFCTSVYAQAQRLMSSESQVPNESFLSISYGVPVYLYVVIQTIQFLHTAYFIFLYLGK